MVVSTVASPHLTGSHHLSPLIRTHYSQIDHRGQWPRGLWVAVIDGHRSRLRLYGVPSVDKRIKAHTHWASDGQADHIFDRLPVGMTDWNVQV